MNKINTFSAWMDKLREQNPAMSGKNVKISSANLENLLMKTWNMGFDACREIERDLNESTVGRLETMFGGFKK